MRNPIHLQQSAPRIGRIDDDLRCWIVIKTHLETPHYAVQLIVPAKVKYQIMVDGMDCKCEVQSVQQPIRKFIRKPREVKSIAANHNTAACQGSVEECEAKDEAGY